MTLGPGRQCSRQDLLRGTAPSESQIQVLALTLSILAMLRIPDPQAVEQQKHAYEKSLDAQLDQASSCSS